ncbi:MAG: hypothetical protein QOG54_2231 [Actinomycetota bacterium]|jgi:hypothetical protein|nr:hypothetical protein [Actinomycetota bacterium]
MHVNARATSAHKFRVALLISSVMAVLLVGALPGIGKAHSLAGGGGGFYFKRSERCLMGKINAIRRNNGRHALNWDKQLGFVARMHANNMASQGGVWHDYSVGQRVTHWVSLGQNTGRGGACKRIIHSFMRSSSHRANILGQWRFIGIGTEWRGRRLYVQQLFESRRNPGNIYSTP